jgi:hypothetical protein
VTFVQWWVGDRSWRGAGGEDDMVGSGMCQCTEFWDRDVKICYWLLFGLEFAEELSVGCAYSGLGIATILLRLLSCDEL